MSAIIWGLFLFFSFANAQIYCDDYCLDGIYYSGGGSYDSQTGLCNYASHRTCEFGCDSAGTACLVRATVTPTPTPRSTVAPTETPRVTCNDYCRDSIYYSGGTYNSQTSACDYSLRRTCEFGCDSAGTTCVLRTTATPTPIPTTLITDCPDYCERGIYYYSGKYNPGINQCDYERRTCKYDCNRERKTCAIPLTAVCPDYCKDGLHYFRGSFNEWTQECDYVYREACEFGCDKDGKFCRLPGETAEVSAVCADRDGRDIYPKGSTTGWDFNKTKVIESSDFCAVADSGAEVTSGQWVVEIQCDADEKIHAYYYQCPENYWCSYGRCVSRPISGTESASATTTVERPLIRTSLDISKEKIVERIRVTRERQPEEIIEVRPARGISTEIVGDTLSIKEETGREFLVEQRFDEMLAKYLGKDEKPERVEIRVEKERPVYDLTTPQRAKLFGFIPLTMRVSKRIDANSLELIREIRPWWSFLASFPQK